MKKRKIEAFVVVYFLMILSIAVYGAESKCPKCSKPTSPAAKGEEYCRHCDEYFSDEAEKVRQNLIFVARNTEQQYSNNRPDKARAYRGIAEDLEHYGKPGTVLSKTQREVIDGYGSVRGLRKASKKAFKGVTAGDIRPLISESEAEQIVRLLIPFLRSIGLGDEINMGYLATCVWFSRGWEAKKNPDDPFSERDYEAFLYNVLGLYLAHMQNIDGLTEDQYRRLVAIRDYLLAKSRFESQQQSTVIADEADSVVGDDTDAFKLMIQELSDGYGNSVDLDLSQTSFNEWIMAGFAVGVEEEFSRIVKSPQGKALKYTEQCSVLKYQGNDGNEYHIFLAFALVMITVHESQLKKLSSQLAEAFELKLKLFPEHNESRIARILEYHHFPHSEQLEAGSFGLCVGMGLLQCVRYAWSGVISWRAMTVNMSVMAFWLILMRLNSK